VREDHLSEGIPTQTRLERDGVAQPSQTERNVRWAATRMCGERPASALADQVDERFSDDNEHRFTSRDDIEASPARRRPDEEAAETALAPSYAADSSTGRAVDPVCKKRP
jgi:hypothetical protein